MSCDAYAVAKYVRHYHAKNGYLPKRGMLGCSDADVDLLIKNGVIEPAEHNGVCLTDKGLRMATDQHHRRG